MWYLAPYLATTLALLGNWFLARDTGSSLGWWIHILASSIWVLFALCFIGQIHFALACAVYLPFEVYGILKWNKRNRNKDE